MADFPPEVEAALKRFLPLYKEDRERWPLWTYRRANFDETAVITGQIGSLAESSDGNLASDPMSLPETVDETRTWTGQRTADGRLRWSWAARLRWSSMWPVNAVMADLDQLARASGMKMVLPGSGNAEVGERWQYEDGSERDVPVGFAPGARTVLLLGGDGFVPVNVPVRLQARTAAAFALTAADGTPQSLEDVSLPGAYMARGFLDDRDFQELLNAIGAALLRNVPSPLSKFLRRVEEVAKKRVDRPEGWTELDKEDFDPLAGDVFRDAGLLPSTQGGSGDKIREPLLGQLMDEAEEIVSEVREWALGDRAPEYSEAVCALLQTDGRDLTPGTKKKLGLQLRFPFLILPEMQLIRCEVKPSVTPDRELRRRFPYLEQEERSRVYGRRTTPWRAASILLRGRLPGNLGYDGLQKRLD